MNHIKIDLTLNLNEEVHVILTPLGESVLKKYVDKFNFPDELKDVYSKKDNVRIFPLWEFMHIFGPMLIMGQEPVTEKNEISFQLDISR